MQRPGLKTFEWHPVVIRSPPTQSVRIKERGGGETDQVHHPAQGALAEGILPNQ